MSGLEQAITEKASPEEVLISNLSEVAAEMSQRLDAQKPAREPYDHSAYNWASEVPHPCLKNLVHCRVDWRERKPMEIEGRWRVDEGTRIEWEVKKWLGNIGFEVTKSQKRLNTDDPELKEFKSLRLTCKIDGMSPLNRELPDPFSRLREVPAEIKTVNPHFWNSTKTVIDINRHSKFWIRKMTGQLNIGIALSRNPGGLLVIATFGKKPRIIPMLFDAEMWEFHKSIARKVNKHVRAGTYPEPMPFDATVCGMCDFNHLCTPLKTTKMVQVSGTDEMELEFYLELKEWNDKFKNEHKRLIGTEKEPGKYWGKDAVVGDISVNTTEQIRKTHNIPPEEKEKFRGPDKKVVITKIERVGK